jgi:hypothetical protein
VPDGEPDGERVHRLITSARQSLLTELREQEQEQEQARRQLEQSSRSSEDAVVGLVHGVTTVVRSIVPTAVVRPEDVIEATYALADKGLRIGRRLALTVTSSVRGEGGDRDVQIRARVLHPAQQVADGQCAVHPAGPPRRRLLDLQHHPSTGGPGQHLLRQGEPDAALPGSSDQVRPGGPGDGAGDADGRDAVLRTVDAGQAPVREDEHDWTIGSRGGPPGHAQVYSGRRVGEAVHRSPTPSRRDRRPDPQGRLTA